MRVELTTFEFSLGLFNRRSVSFEGFARVPLVLIETFRP